MTALGFGAVSLIPLYLAFLGLGSGLTARAAGRSVWLLGKNASRWSSLRYWQAFALAFLGPLIQTALPALHEADPVWREAGGPWGGVPGLLLAVTGALLAVAGQATMGSSWRVGVIEDTVGDLVTEGPFRLSRNPVFVGQVLLLVGVALAAPSLPGLFATWLFAAAAAAQVSVEERALEAHHGTKFRAYRDRVPRWIGFPWTRGR